jgi:HAD superfamily hydrolase (TIGR01509 family)
VTALSRLGVLDLFSAVLVCSELDCDKTEPTVYRAAAELFGTKKEETAVFEDSLYALMTAKNDGFYTVAVRDDAEPDQSAMMKEADIYLSSLSALDL